VTFHSCEFMGPKQSRLQLEEVVVHINTQSPQRSLWNTNQFDDEDIIDSKELADVMEYKLDGDKPQVDLAVQNLMVQNLAEHKDLKEDIEETKRQLAKCRNRTIKVGLLGPANAGKSSLIKGICMLGKEGEPKVCAKNGETTKAHVFIVDNAVEFIDLPGLGWGQDEAVVEYIAQRVDLCLMVVSDHFNHDVLRIHHKLKGHAKRKVKFFYVMTHVDGKEPEDLDELERQIRHECQVPDEERVFRTCCKNFSMNKKAPEVSGVHAPESNGEDDDEKYLCPAITSYFNTQKHDSLFRAALWISTTGSKSEKVKHCKRIIGLALPSMVAAVWTPFGGGAMSIGILCLALRQMAVCYKLSDEAYANLKKAVLPKLYSRILMSMCCVVADIIPVLYVPVNSFESVCALGLGGSSLFSALKLLKDQIPLDDAKAVEEVQNSVRACFAMARMHHLYKQSKSIQEVVNRMLDPNDEEIRQLGLAEEEIVESVIETMKLIAKVCQHCGKEIIGEPTYFVSDCHTVTRYCDGCVDDVKFCLDQKHEDQPQICGMMRCYNDPRQPCKLCDEPESLDNLVVLQCGHVMCRDCTIDSLARQLGPERQCPWRHMLKKDQEIHTNIDVKLLLK
jgi:GTP-binding protein EngB required for normal cell division